MRCARGPHVARVVLVLLSAATAASAHVTVVQPGSDPAGNLQAAINAAADGDTLLVPPGNWLLGLDSFGHYVVKGKGLTIAATGPGHVLFDSLEIVNLPAGSTMVLQGVDLHRVSPYDSQFFDDVLVVFNCAGSVWMQDALISAKVSYVGGIGGFFVVKPGWSGTFVKNSADVHFVRCALSGGAGHDAFSGQFQSYGAASGGQGAHIDHATVTFHDCTLAGGSGGAGNGFFLDGLDGAGLLVGSSTVLLAGSSATGFGADAANEFPGDGLRAIGGASAVWLRDGSFTAGLGQPAAQDVSAPAGTLTALDAPARSLVVPSPLHEQEAATLTVTGQPGDLAFVLASASGNVQLVPSLQGALELDAPLVGPLPLGVLPGAPPGTEVTLALPFHAPALPASVDQALTVLLQLAVVADGQPLLENGSSLLLLEAGLP